MFTDHEMMLCQEAYNAGLQEQIKEYDLTIEAQADRIKELEAEIVKYAGLVEAVENYIANYNDGEKFTETLLRAHKKEFSCALAALLEEGGS